MRRTRGIRISGAWAEDKRAAAIAAIPAAEKAERIESLKHRADELWF